MIVAMKKISAVVLKEDADSALEKLRSLGVLHVEYQQAPSSKNINELQNDITLLDEATGILTEAEFRKGSPAEHRKAGGWKFVAQHIVNLRKRYAQLQEYSLTLKSGISQWQAWGDFAPEIIKDLNARNIFIGFYQIPVKEIKNLPEDVTVKTIAAKAGMANCVLISREKIEVPFKELTLPRMGLGKMQERLKEDARVTGALKSEIQKHAVYLENFLRTRELLKKELEFRRAKAGMGEAGRLMYLTGYAPYDTVGALSETAKKAQWAITIDDPLKEDAVPTLIRNPRWVSIIQPVFKLIEVIPGYRELDISPLFLIFLSLFFGMIIGDAGYGAVYFLLALIWHKKFSRRLSDKRIFFLLYVFSSCAIFWGLLTGTVFGQGWYLRAGLKPFIPVLNDTKFLQAFCFFLGALHLSLAHGWQAVRKAPSLTALSDIGWVFVLWAAFFLAKTLILNDPFPFFGKGLIMAGLVLVIFCTNPQRNILKTIGYGLGSVALSLVNNFTDVVSYVRLFAVGLAGVAIADTINSLASGFGQDNIIAKTLIVFAGHTINIILGPMSVLVHGIRLNVLEFSSHAGLSWSGLAYKPLQE